MRKYLIACASWLTYMTQSSIAQVAAESHIVPQISATGEPIRNFGTLENSENYLAVVKMFVENIETFGGWFITMGGAAIIVFGTLVVFVAGRTKDDLRKEQEKNADELRKSTEERLKSGQEATERTFEKLQMELQFGIRGTTEKIESLHRALPVEISNYVRKADGELIEPVAKLKNQLQEYQEIIQTFQDVSEAMRADAQDQFLKDPWMNYKYADHLAREIEDPNNDEYQSRRIVARTRLEGTLAAAREGNVDANLLFNSAMAASRIEMDDLALKLFSYAEYFAPSTSHKLALYRLQTTLGRRYTVERKSTDNTETFVINAVEAEPSKIESEAFTNALRAAADAPLPQNEIIYAELWNMAQKVRERQGYERMLDVLLTSYRARKGETIVLNEAFRHVEDIKSMKDVNWTDQAKMQIPSNLPGKISAIFALTGTKDWHLDYEMFLQEALELAVNESPITTWRFPCLRDIVTIADDIGRGDEMVKRIEKLEIQDGKLTQFLSQRADRSQIENAGGLNALLAKLGSLDVEDIH